jgi:hypothetical protein
MQSSGSRGSNESHVISRGYLERSSEACVENGKHLLGDAKIMFDWDRYSTAFALAVLSQEEFAKAA